jgi:hypothetical protein
MQKSMWLMAALLFSMFISGCGGGATTSVIASTTTAFASSDVSNKTLYSTSTKGYIAFQIFSDGSAKWDSTENTYPVPLADVSGTWAISNGQLILSVAGIPAYQFTCIQKESNYFLTNEIKYDGSNNIVLEKITRMYFNQADALTYLNSITLPNGGIKLGGAFQGVPLPAFNNVSTVVGVTGKFVTFADYTSTTPPGRTPPVLLGRPVGITTIDGKTYFVLDNYSNRIQVVTLDSNGAAINVKTLGSASIPSTDLLFNSPSDITNDGENLYVTDTYNYTIDKIALTLNTPDGIPADNYYTGTLSILAGATGVSGVFDGTGNTPTIGTTVGAVGVARFVSPIGITTDGTNLYVTDNNTIRKIDLGAPTAAPLVATSPPTTPQVTTLAGYPGLAGTADAVGLNARFNLPLRLTTDGTYLYVADGNNYAIRKVAIATGQVTTIAGTPGIFGTNPTKDANGNPITAQTGENTHFNGPNGITTDGTNLYVTDWGPVIYGGPQRGQVIFSVSLTLIPSTLIPNGFTSSAVTKIAGTQNAISTDTNLLPYGPNQPSPLAPNSALFNCPIGITTDGTSLYVTDTDNYTIRKIFKR